jgi:hypothetical protein
VPTFDELAVREVVVMDFVGTLEWRRETFIARARIMQPGASTVPDEGFVSDGQSFPEGVPVDTDTNFNQYLVAYGHDLRFGTLLVRPLVGVSIVNVRYRIEIADGFSAPGDPSVEYRVTRPAAQLGGDLVWRPGGRGAFSVAARGLYSLPIDGLAEVHEADFLARYDIFRDPRGLAHATLFTGVGFQHTEYEDDDDPIPNRFVLDLAPMLTFGFELRF